MYHLRNPGNTDKMRPKPKTALNTVFVLHRLNSIKIVYPNNLHVVENMPKINVVTCKIIGIDCH